MKIRVILCVIFLLFSCTELFFPPTGTPSNSFLPRATPEGVINQLIDAYESGSIELIEDLLADSFQFYVAPSFVSSYEKYSYYNPEPIDTTLQFLIVQPYYYYWKRKNEIERTKVIFANTITSEFTTRPYIASQEYKINDTNDTVGVELLLKGGTLTLVTYGRGQQLVDVDNQVFLLRRDFERLWKIRKWYDCSESY